MIMLTLYERVSWTLSRIFHFLLSSRDSEKLHQKIDPDTNMSMIKIKDDTFREVFKKHNKGSLECSDTNLGETIAWLMLNRPPHVEVEI